MPLCSMTGFARVDGAGTGLRWTWELRSVNGKALDVRFRLPSGFEDLEAPARERVSAAVARGNVQAALTVKTEVAAGGIRINEAALEELVRALKDIGSRLDIAPPTLDSVLTVRGIVDMVESEADESVHAAHTTQIIADLDKAIAALVANREREGAALGTVLTTRLAEIERLTKAAEDSPARTPEAIKARLAEQVAALIEASSALDADRLHQEAVLLATRADIREELDRLVAHVAAARDLLAEAKPVGRRLDFLAQEFNREVNTLCAKSNDRGLTAIGLDMKAIVDQFREQIQNLE